MVKCRWIKCFKRGKMAIFEGDVRTGSVYKAQLFSNATDDVKRPPAELVVLTIVLTTCDRPDIVTRAIGSVLRQDAGRWRLLVVDDGRSSVEQLIPGDDRIAYARTTGRIGAAAARNLGMGAAKTPWIVLLDDDDEMEPGFVAHFFAAIAPNIGRPAFAVSDWRILDYGDGEAAPLDRRRTYEISPDGGPRNIQQALRAGSCGLAVNQKALQKAGPMDTGYRFVEDTEWLLRLIETECDILYATGPGFIIHNRRSPDQLSDARHLHARILECERLKRRYGDLRGRYPPLASLFDGLMETYRNRARSASAVRDEGVEMVVEGGVD